eukprot:scaffold3467_cov118-Cylindrotheca_fusiformis.AAC.7
MDSFISGFIVTSYQIFESVVVAGIEEYHEPADDKIVGKVPFFWLRMRPMARGALDGVAT